ncbi:MAG: hypothetical protein AAB410_03415 [Patescibacteria group bacterium]
MTRSKTGSVAEQLRQETVLMLQAEQKQTGEARMEWREFMGIIATGVDFKINPGYLLMLLLVKDSPVRVMVELRE